MARNLSVLIVDPNENSRFEVAKTAEAVGLDLVGEAGYGTEAVVLTSECRPNVVLIALEDPVARGLATVEAIQNVASDIPLIAYSSSREIDLIREAMRWGARDYLPKPMESDALRDAVSAVLEQEEQRQLARWGDGTGASPRGTVVTVAGAKGGIGKSTLSANLALALRHVTGDEVALVDGDAQFGDVGVMLDLDAERSIADLARGTEEINRDTILSYLHKHPTGINVLIAASEPDDWRALQPEHVSAIARSLAETHEFVVFDTPGTMNEVVAASLNEAGIVLLVTSLDISSVKDTRTALRILDAWGYSRDRVRLIVNDNTRAAAVTAADVAQAAGLEVATFIKYEPRVGLAVQTGMPLVESQPRNAFSRSVLQIAETLSGVAAPATRPSALSARRLPLLRRLSA